MLISHTKKFIYQKTKKTASTSLESYFEKFCVAPNTWIQSEATPEFDSQYGVISSRGPANKLKTNSWKNHMSAFDVKAKVPQKLWNSYFKFTSIRHPIDKFISFFFFKDMKLHSNTAEEVEELLQRQSFVNSFYDRNIYCIDGEICIDKFIRYEYLMEDLEDVCRILNVPFEPERLATFKKAQNKPDHYEISDILTPKSKQILYNIYDWEMNYFNYEEK